MSALRAALARVGLAGAVAAVPALSVSLFAVACGSRTTIDVATSPPDARIDALDAATDVRDARGQDAPADAPRDVIPDGPRCRSDSDCDDGIDCTVEACVASRCSVTPEDERCPVSYACEPGVGCQARAWVVGVIRNTTERKIWDVRLPSGRIAETASLPISPTDIALSPSGELIGVGSTGYFRLERQGGTWSATNLPDPLYSINPSGLDFSPNGRLYGSRARQLLEVDQTSFSVTAVARFPDNLLASGDVAVVGNHALATATSGQGGDRLVRFDLTTRSATVIGVLGAACVHGLAAFAGDLYGFTCWGEMLRIEPDTAKSAVIAKVGGDVIFAGATAR